MPYKVSNFRRNFESRTSSLISTSYTAHRKSIAGSVRDLAFQGAIIQASAAIEDYIREVFDAWAFKLKTNAMNGSTIPYRARVATVKPKLEKHFSSFGYTHDEMQFLKKLEDEKSTWDFLTGSTQIPNTFDGSSIYNERKYPSVKNLKVLYCRIGVDNIFAEISRIIKADAEMRLESFNSIRSALAHSNPPQLTYLDVKRNISDVQSLVQGMDRVIFRTLSRNFGGPIW